MSPTAHVAFLSLWTLSAGCASPAPVDTPRLDTGGLPSDDPAPDGWLPDPDRPGTAWSWAGGRVRLSVEARDGEDRTRGVWIERDGRPLASSLPSGQRVPLLVATPRSDGAPIARSVQGDRLVLALNGSTEHGCPADALDVAVDVDPTDGTVTVLAAGVPYVLLDANPVIVVEAPHEVQAVLPDPGSDWVSDRVVRLMGTSGGRPVRVGFAEPPPWLQLQRHGPAVEVDLDHSCERRDFEAGLISIRIPA